LNDLSGKKVSIEDYRGKVVLLNFWTRTCGPCMDEMPEIAELTHVLQSRPDVAVVTISTDESAAVVKDVLKGVIREEKPPFQVLIDPDGEQVVDKKFGTHLFPETWIIDARGIIRARFDGSRNWSGAEVVEMIDEVRSGGYCPLNVKSGESEMTGEGAHVCAALTGQGAGTGG
jgi:peroxiredoxin